MPSGGASEPNTSRRIFVSYARADRALAEKLAAQLDRSGYGVWWDHLLVAGEDYRTRIAEQIRAADRVIVMWSVASVASAFVIDEAQRAHQMGKLVPLVLGPAEPPMGFGHLHAIMVDAHHAEEAFPALIASLAGQPPPPSPKRLSRKGAKVARIVSVLALGGLGAGAYALYPGLTSQDPTTGLDPKMGYHIFHSEDLGLRLVYPRTRLMVDTTQQQQGRLPLVTTDRRQEVLVTRRSSSGPSDPRIAREVEREELERNGCRINYAGPSNASNWSNWYVLSGQKADGTEFYYRRWLLGREMASIEFEYDQAELSLYHDIIEAMTLGGRFEIEPRR